jgi:hypothetical protein
MPVNLATGISNPAEAMIFKGNINQQHSFLRTANKAGGHMW